MKLALLAVSTLFGAVSFVSASFAQGDAGSVDLGRVQVQDSATVVLQRSGSASAAPTLEGDRPPAGALPPPPTTIRSYATTTDSKSSLVGGSLRQGLRLH